MNDRFGAVLRLYAFGILGVFLLVAPWTALWDQATQMLAASASWSWVRSGWARGLASGLGALDLLAAVRAGLELRARGVRGGGR